MEKYSEGIINFIKFKVKFINEENLKQINANNISLISIIENIIDKQILSSVNKCLILYLTDLTKNDSLKKELLEDINNKYSNNIIKIKEIKEINFILIYNISEEIFIDENIEELKEYFEDYLSQIKESLEYEEIKKKLMEEIELEEIIEQERRQKFILPKINTCEIIDVSENEIIINVPLFEENEILEKNRDTIKNCIKKFGKKKIEYIVYLYNQDKNNYDKYLYQKIKENINEERKKYKIKISNLKPDKIYMILLGIKFGNNYSIPNFNKFYFMTSSKRRSGHLFIYGDKKYKNNLTDEKKRIILPKNIISYNSCFEKDKTLFPLLFKTIIRDISISDTRLGFIQNENDFCVFESGSIINIQPGDLFEGSFPKEKEKIYLSENKHFLEYFDSNIHKIQFDIKIKKLRVGVNHCLALSYYGECYSWGENKFGQLGLGERKDIIVGNPKKIKFDLFDYNGNKLITEISPFFYDIAVGNYFSLSLGIYNNKQILYYWGNGAGIINDDTTKIIQSIYPKQINNIENIIDIYAKFNSIGIICYDKEKKLNNLYIHGTQRFGIDASLELYNKSNPIIVNYFKDINFHVFKINFSLNCMSVIGKNMNNNKNEIYLRGELTKKLFQFKDYKTNFYKLDNNWSESVVGVSPQEKVIFFLLKNGVIKKLYNDENILCEKEIKIVGYNLNDLELNNIKNVEFQSFKGDNFIVFYNFQ